MKIKIISCLILALGLISLGLLGKLSYAKNSAVTQVIEFIDCRLDMANHGIGWVMSPLCNGAILPVFDGPHETREQSPILYGRFDAINTTALKIRINGTWYKLGETPALTTSGNNWKLNLAGLQVLNPDLYDVKVETTTTGFLLLDNYGDPGIRILRDDEPFSTSDGLPPKKLIPVLNGSLLEEAGSNKVITLPNGNNGMPVIITEGFNDMLALKVGYSTYSLVLVAGVTTAFWLGVWALIKFKITHN